ncbi:hypothetical protein C8J57DRAFT_1286919 [Mycena rebaudengoi]|nr:hypothetical protein C8J57DRAFT_1286919 [Mycena rebaudengoi]
MSRKHPKFVFSSADAAQAGRIEKHYPTSARSSLTTLVSPQRYKFWVISSTQPTAFSTHIHTSTQLPLAIFSIIMFFTPSFLSAAFVTFCSVAAMPQPEGQGLAARGGSSCDPGSYLSNGTCVACPPGNTCAGGTKTPQACDYGKYQPSNGSVSCIETTPGYYQPNRGASDQIPCPRGTYQPYAYQKFCYGAPKGRFQNYAGQATVCGTCCGWAAPQVNNNMVAVNCTGSTPNAYPSSGDGCISKSTDCVHAATCSQLADGTCPAETIYG